MDLLNTANRINPLKYYYIGKYTGIVYRIKAINAYNAYNGLLRVRGSNLDDRSVNHLFSCSTIKQAEEYQKKIRNLEIID